MAQTEFNPLEALQFFSQRKTTVKAKAVFSEVLPSFSRILEQRIDYKSSSHECCDHSPPKLQEPEYYGDVRPEGAVGVTYQEDFDFSRDHFVDDSGTIAARGRPITEQNNTTTNEEAHLDRTGFDEASQTEPPHPQPPHPENTPITDADTAPPAQTRTDIANLATLATVSTNIAPPEVQQNTASTQPLASVQTSTTETSNPILSFLGQQNSAQQQNNVQEGPSKISSTAETVSEAAPHTGETGQTATATAATAATATAATATAAIGIGIGIAGTPISLTLANATDSQAEAPLIAPISDSEAVISPHIVSASLVQNSAVDSFTAEKPLTLTNAQAQTTSQILPEGTKPVTSNQNANPELLQGTSSTQNHRTSVGQPSLAGQNTTPSPQASQNSAQNTQNLPESVSVTTTTQRPAAEGKVNTASLVSIQESSTQTQNAKNAEATQITQGKTLAQTHSDNNGQKNNALRAEARGNNSQSRTSESQNNSTSHQTSSPGQIHQANTKASSIAAQNQQQPNSAALVSSNSQQNSAHDARTSSTTDPALSASGQLRGQGRNNDQNPSGQNQFSQSRNDAGLLGKDGLTPTQTQISESDSFRQQLRQTSAAARQDNPAQLANSVRDQVKVNIQRAIDEGADRIRIQLHPRQLGRIEASLEISKSGQLQILLSADRPETLELLQRDQRDLQQALQNAGLDANGDNLKFALSGRQQDSSQGNSPFGSNRQQGGQDNTQDDIASLESDIVTSAFHHNEEGRVDIRV